MNLRRMVRRMTLQYEDHVEEQEFLQNKLPFITGFLKYIILTITAILIPYAVRYFIKDIFPQNIIILCLIPGGLLLLLLKKKYEKCMDYFLLAYIVAIIAVLSSVYPRLLGTSNSNEGFYMGYAFAMIHRLIGYQVIHIQCVVVLYIISNALRYPLVYNHDAVLIIIVTVLDILTIVLSYKSERMERSRFHALYKKKKEISKFKQFMTQYLPNQMVIFGMDYNDVHYMNNCFKRTFKCENLAQIKQSLDALLIEEDVIEKQKQMFLSLGFKPKEDGGPISLSYFMDLLSQNTDLFQDVGTLTFPVIEKEKEEALLEDKTQQKDSTKDSSTFRANFNTRKGARENGKDGTIVAPFDEENSKSYDRGSSRSMISDIMYEEGRRRAFKVKIFPLIWDEGEALAVMLDDITQQKIIMELKVADKNKNLVIAMVSHELRTPLNAMLGFLDIALKQIMRPDVMGYLKACRNSGVLMLNLINSILDINQIKSKKLKLNHTKISLREFLLDIKALFESYSMMKNLSFDIDIGPQVPKTILTDRSRLNQILLNLLGNAFKFTFSGGVTLKVERESISPCVLKFSVQDTGIGIKKDDLNKLFKMYGRIDHNDKQINTSGVGLGLTISNTLATLLNPTDGKGITVESEPEQGSCFYFFVQSQSLESSSMREQDEDSQDDKTLGISEGRNTTLLKKMTVYSVPTHKDNFTKMMTGSSSNFDLKKITQFSNEKNLKAQLELKDKVLPLNSEEARLNEEDSLNTSNEDESYLENLDEVRPNVIDKCADLPPLEADRELTRDASKPSKPSCLVVDDNPFNLMVACHLMKERNYEVVTAMNGQEAIYKFQEHQRAGGTFSIVLMDCQMPVMDGFQATKILTGMMKEGFLTETPIIALTANNRDDEHDKLCENVGMSGHIGKPLQIEELENILKKSQKKK